MRMSPAVWLERFQPLETNKETHGVTEEQEGTTRPDTTGPGPAAKPQGLAKKTKSKPSKKSETSAKETDPTSG